MFGESRIPRHPLLASTCFLFGRSSAFGGRKGPNLLRKQLCASGSPRPVIGMPRSDRLHPIKLFRQHPAHQKMRPGERAEREPIFRPRLHRLIQPFRTADHEARCPPGLIPTRQQRGQAFGIRRGAAKIQGNGDRAGRDGAKDGRTLSPPDFSGAAARFGDFNQFRRRA